MFCLCFLSERNCKTLPLLPACNCSQWMQLWFLCHDTCCQALSPLEITIKMVHWQAVPFVTVGDSEIFPVIFIIAVGNFLKLCILIKYFFFLSVALWSSGKKSLLFHFHLSRDEQKSVAWQAEVPLPLLKGQTKTCWKLFGYLDKVKIYDWIVYCTKGFLFDPVYPTLIYLMPFKGEEYMYSSDKYSDISKR